MCDTCGMGIQIPCNKCGKEEAFVVVTLNDGSEMDLCEICFNKRGSYLS